MKRLMRKGLLLLICFICLFLFTLSKRAFASNLSCTIVDEDGYQITTASLGDIVYLVGAYIKTSSGKIKWEVTANMPSIDLSNYKMSMKYSGYYHHEGSSDLTYMWLPVLIPPSNYIEGTAIFTGKLSKIGKCSGTLYISRVKPPTQDIKGTYSLTAFKVIYSNGNTLTQNDVNVSGTMDIGKYTITQSIMIEGIPIELTGTYTVTYTQGTSEGYFTVTDASGMHNLSFLISGNNITTYSGVVSLGNGLTFEEWDTWTKVSDYSPGIATAQSIKNQIPESNFLWIGEILNERKNLIHNR